MRLPVPALCFLAACATVPTAEPSAIEPGTMRAAELARVRCLLVAPLDNASDAPLAADAATGVLVSGVDPARVRVFPIRELRGLFRDTPLELPEGVPPSLALELAEILGADAALYGAVEGRGRGGEASMLVTLRLELVGPRDLLFATSRPVSPEPGETPESAVRRTVGEVARPLLERLGGSPPAAGCFDPARTARLRALATGHAAAARQQAPPAAPPDAPSEPAPSTTLTRAVPTRNARQADWAKRLSSREHFVLYGIAFEGRTARLSKAAGLADLAGALAAAPDVGVRIEGFVDATADPDKDAQLSMAMAQAAGQKLVELGVSRDRITWAGRGGEKPLLPNFTARGRAANRRLEVVGRR
jgi:outer membrane protein OmpA-like peptidoglycan-associated protein